MSWLIETLRQHPEVALFLTLAIGQALARIKVGPIQLNGVVAALLAGVAVGQLRIQVPQALQWAFFVLFLFSIGYQTGPQFFRGLGRSALPQVGLSVLLCGVVLATAFALSRFLGFDAGAGAGLLAGGLNASAAIGTAGNALDGLALDAATAQALATSLTVAFAVTYLVGLLTEVFTLTTIGPWLMRADLPAECRQLEADLGVGGDEAGVSAYQDIAVRAYTIPAALDGIPVADLEGRFAPARVYVERLRGKDGVVDPAPGMRLRTGDIVALSGRQTVLVDTGNPLAAEEVSDPGLLDIPTVTAEVMITAKALAGQTVAQLGATIGQEEVTRGVFVRQVVRGGQKLPFGPGLRVERGDVVVIVGRATQIGRAAALVGAPLLSSTSTDMLALAGAIAIGGLAGLASFRLAGLEIGLSMPVGVLVGGLVAGWLRSVRPALARVPEPVLKLFDGLGLTGFLAVVGINAGPGFVDGLRTSGGPLVLAGVLVCLVPNVVTILAGRYLLRIHPGVLLGICAGAGTSPAGLAAVQDKAKSQVPTLGYGVSYAVGNLLLALWGSVLVTLLRP
jgi:putative transport protein